MAENKNYLSFTGLTDFYYGKLDSNDEGIDGGQAERVEFLQNINISTPQTIVKAYGDNGVAEMAMSTDATTLTTQFHHLPIEDRQVIYGRSEEHTSELQSRFDLVCRLLLEKKKI